MASRMHFFTFLMALAVLFALASAAQLEDSPVSEGAVVPEVTEAPNKDLAKFSSDSLVAELLQRGVDPATNLLAMTGTSCSRKLRSKIKSLKKIESKLLGLEKLNIASFKAASLTMLNASLTMKSASSVASSARDSKRIFDMVKTEIAYQTARDLAYQTASPSKPSQLEKTKDELEGENAKKAEYDARMLRDARKVAYMKTLENK